MVPDEALCRIVTTRECNLGQVDFIDKGYKDAANLLVKQQLKKRIPHVVCETFPRA